MDRHRPGRGPLSPDDTDTGRTDGQKPQDPTAIEIPGVPRRVLGGPSLLTTLLTEHLDPAYTAAAERRAADPSTEDTFGPARRSLRWAVALALLLTGGLLAAAYDQTRDRAPSVAKMRSELVSSVRQRTADVDALERREQNLARQVEVERSRALADSTDGAAVSARLTRSRAAAAQSVLSGSGVVVEVGDGDTQTPTGGGPRNGADSDTNRVEDRDLQQIVNALWAAGARGIAVGGQRLTPTSTIREAGSAVLVDFRPLTSPYTITAIGDPDAIEPAFAESAIARSFTTYTQLYGMTFSTRRSSKLSVPAAGSHTVSYAQPVPTTSPTPTGSPPGSRSGTSPSPEGSAPR